MSIPYVHFKQRFFEIFYNIFLNIDMLSSYYVETWYDYCRILTEISLLINSISNILGSVLIRFFVERLREDQ